MRIATILFSLLVWTGAEAWGQVSPMGTTSPDASASTATQTLAATGPVASPDATGGTLVGQALEDHSGNPLPGVQIVVIGTLRGTLTDLDGRFHLDRLREGEYRVEARFVGFEPVPQTVRITSGKETRLDIRLREQTVDLGEIVTEANRFPASASSLTLRAQDLPGRARQTTPELLELVPGLVASQHAGGGKAEQLFLRGFDADHGTDVALSIDGMPINLVSHGHGQGYADLHFFIPETIEAIRVEKGPHSTDVGDLATAGAIAFQTRGSLDANQIRLDAGSFNSRRVLAMASLPGNDQGYVAGAFESGDGPFESPQGVRKAHLFARGSLDVTKGGTLDVTAGTYNALWTASGQIPQRAVETGLITRFGAIDDTEGGSTSRTWATAQFKKPTGAGRLTLDTWASRYTFQLFSNFTYFLENPEAGDMIEQTDERTLAGANLRLDRSSTVSGILLNESYGLGLRGDATRVGLWQSPGRTRGTTLDHSRIAQGSASVWSDWTAVLGAHVRVNVGVRADGFSFGVRSLEGPDRSWNRNTAAIISPKGSLVISPTANTDFFLSAGAGFHSNDARSVVGSNGNDTPLARAIGQEVGVRLKPSSTLLVSLSAWRLTLDREFVFVGDAGTTELSGASLRRGLDASVAAQVAERLSFTANGTLSRGRFVDEPEGMDRIPLAPTMTASAMIKYHATDRIETALRVTHLGSRALNEDASVTARPQTLVNFNVGVRLRAVSLDAAVLNLLDTQWNEAQFASESRLRGETAGVTELHFTPGTPRALRMGMAYSF